jgi:hypothetical protein
MSLSDGDITDPYTDGTTVQLNVQDSIDCTSEDAAELFKQLVTLTGMDTVATLEEQALPRTEADLQAFVDAYEETAGSLETVENEIADLENQLNEAVYDLFGLDTEMRKYIAETVKTPTTPVRPKAMSD